MKFWRQSLLAAFSFIAVSFSVVYTSCTDDSCTKVKCRNGGTCVDGFCKCPTGYEGNQCIGKASDRYTGFYEGTVIIDGKPPVIDSALVRHVNLNSGYQSATTVLFTLFTRSSDIITCPISADGKISFTDSAGRKIMLVENNEQLYFNCVEIVDGKEQTVKFTGTLKRPD